MQSIGRVDLHALVITQQEPVVTNFMRIAAGLGLGVSIELHASLRLGLVALHQRAPSFDLVVLHPVVQNWRGTDWLIRDPAKLLGIVPGDLPKIGCGGDRALRKWWIHVGWTAYWFFPERWTLEEALLEITS